MNKTEKFLTVIRQNTALMEIVTAVAGLQLKNWYVSAGAVFQSYWNYEDGKPLMENVHDIDVTFFDAENADPARDKELESLLTAQFPIYEFDVHNEAHMHTWWGRNLAPYTSAENAMERWIATVHAVGVTVRSDGELRVFAPYGFADIFTRTIRPILHADNSRALYESKVKKWQARFDKLTVIPWSEELSVFLKIAEALNLNGISPYLLGSLGVQQVLAVSLDPEDIDIQIFDKDLAHFDMIIKMMKAFDFEMIDPYEHAFSDGKTKVAFGNVETLENWAGIRVAESDAVYQNL